ncbi:BPI fold-containing B member 6 [Saguinus oedipus]|uniref:BPI fold-containing B member 6 n=1 Tax=Saguinus oedipus TaxID=9490 RepID=A0ABQ9VKC6_SAGOE|nr:BPI fold-containing B member 6 [Saguinus oedipus]
MLRILGLALCSLLTCTQAEPGALLRLGMDIMNHEVQSAMDESHILEKMAAEAGKKQPGMKPIKGITNLKVKDVQLPVITLDFVPGVGVFQCVSTGMTITGKSFMGGNMEIIVTLNITATNRLLQDEETGLPMFKSESCEVILVNVKTNLPSNMLPKVVNKFLDSTLHKVLPGLMCPAIDAVLEYVNRKWTNLSGECSSSHTLPLPRDIRIDGLRCPIAHPSAYFRPSLGTKGDPMPVGQMGTVKYVLTFTPTTTASYIQVDFSVSSGGHPGAVSGSLVRVVGAASARTAPFAWRTEIPLDIIPQAKAECLPLTVPQPVVQQRKGKAIKLAGAEETVAFPEGYAEGSSQLLLSAALLSSELALLQKSFHVNIQNTTIGELPPQTTETLAGFIPEMAVAYPKSKPLMAQIRINKPPKITMKTGKSLLHLHGTLEMFVARRRGKTTTSLFRLEVITELVPEVLIDWQLQCKCPKYSCEKELTGFITDYLEEAYIPVVNDVLQVGLPLPDFLAMNYNLAELHIVENALMLDLKLE